jgi:hypothetical protein
MARNTIAQMGAFVVLTLGALGACDRGPTGVNSTDLSFTRGTGKGGGKGGGTAAEQPTMAISPTQLTLSVGQKSTVAVTYWDNRGNIIPTTDEKLVYYGCRKVVDTDPDCYSVIQILPLQPYGREAEITAKAPGSVILWAYDGVTTWVTSNVTVQ